MGVLRSSSCLITSSQPDAGLRGSSEGNVADRGVLNFSRRAEGGGFISPGRADRGVQSSLGTADRGVRRSLGRADRGIFSSLGRADLGTSSCGKVGVLSGGKTGLGVAEGMMDGRKVRCSSSIRERGIPNERPGEASRERWKR